MVIVEAVVLAGEEGLDEMLRHLRSRYRDPVFPVTSDVAHEDPIPIINQGPFRDLLHESEVEL